MLRPSVSGKSKPLALRSVGAPHIGSLVTVRGIVTHATDVKPLITVATYLDDASGIEVRRERETFFLLFWVFFECSMESGKKKLTLFFLLFHFFLSRSTLQVYQEVTSKVFTPLTALPAGAARRAGGAGAGGGSGGGGNGGGVLHLQTRGSKFVKYQEVKLQELPLEVPPGSTPRSITVQLRGEMTRTMRPGDSVVVSGIFLPEAPTPGLMGSGRNGGAQGSSSALLAKTFLEATRVDHDKQSYASAAEDQALAAAVDAAAAAADVYDRLAGSLAPEIFGHGDVKKALLLALVGGVTRSLPDGMRLRGDVHVCLMGDPGVAKSQLLKHVAHLAPRAVYTTGRGSSGVGLTAAVTRDPVTGEGREELVVSFPFERERKRERSRETKNVSLNFPPFIKNLNLETKNKTKNRRGRPRGRGPGARRPRHLLHRRVRQDGRGKKIKGFFLSLILFLSRGFSLSPEKLFKKTKKTHLPPFLSSLFPSRPKTQKQTDRTAIHEVMEQQTVSIAKAGITTTLNTRATLLAAANPAWGRYDVRRSPAENIALPAALLSRFDLMWLILDRADPDGDRALAAHVLEVHATGAAPTTRGGAGGGEEGAAGTGGTAGGAGAGAADAAQTQNASSTFLPPAVLRAYVARAKQCSPSVPESLTEYIAAVYAEMRAEEAAASVPHSYTTARTLLSILRLAQALARLRFAEQVGQAEVDEALRLMRMSKHSLLDDAYTGAGGANAGTNAARARADPASAIYGSIRDDAQRSRRLTYGWGDLVSLLGRHFSHDQIRASVEEYAEYGVFSLEYPRPNEPTVVIAQGDLPQGGGA